MVAASLSSLRRRLAAWLLPIKAPDVYELDLFVLTKRIEANRLDAYLRQLRTQRADSVWPKH